MITFEVEFGPAEDVDINTGRTSPDIATIMPLQPFYQGTYPPAFLPIETAFGRGDVHGEILAFVVVSPA